MSVGNNFRKATKPRYRILHEKINFVLGLYSRTNAISVLRRMASLTSSNFQRFLLMGFYRYTQRRACAKSIDALLEIFASEEKSIQYLLDHGVLESDRKCSKYRKPMKIDLTRKLWRCSQDSCRKQSSLLKKSFFETCKVPLNKIF
ncbi:hypothetical protein HZS_1958 [Henneguya salminicola]|nr:hypothetical protein HZS_1958 [Henneguya salminicola]